MINALSFDLEDWFCAHNLRAFTPYSTWESQQLRIVSSTRVLLDLLDRRQVRATFFVLGWIADRAPDLIREIAARGHEIGTHGYAHRLLTEMSPGDFESDLQRALDVTGRLVEKEIIGSRVPCFTMTPSTSWGLAILRRNGLLYDSSVFPVACHPDYGWPGASLGVSMFAESIVEFPLACSQIAGLRIPHGGGAYFRLLPYWITRALFRRCNREGRPMMFYLHPWEVDPMQPRLPLSCSARLRHYSNLSATYGRLERLLEEFRFAPVRTVLGL
jgi:polysaccharide deacetylase family protein (PEP-CTERM system associated)